jgi:hypothetical protein
LQLAGPCKDGMEVKGSKVKGGMFGTSEVGSRGDSRGLGGDEGEELCRAVLLHCAVSRHFVLLRVSRNDQFVSHKKQNRFYSVSGIDFGYPFVTKFSWKPSTNEYRLSLKKAMSLLLK